MSNIVEVRSEVVISEWAAMPRGPRTISVRRDLGNGQRLHMRIAERKRARSLLVLMPAAQSRIEQGQINPLFSRWNWIPDYPDAHVIAVSDPAIYADKSLSAAWFISPQIDIIDEISRAVDETRSQLEVAPEAVVTYGSSLGGFGALGVAAMLPGTRAVAEIPQLDLCRWPVPTALAALERHVTGMPLEKYRADHPEQLDVLERFRKVASVPEFLLITNPQDHTYGDHLGLLRAVHELGPQVEVRGASRLRIDPRVSGHRVLSREDASVLLRRELATL